MAPQFQMTRSLHVELRGHLKTTWLVGRAVLIGSILYIMPAPRKKKNATTRVEPPMKYPYGLRNLKTRAWQENFRRRFSLLEQWVLQLEQRRITRKDSRAYRLVCTA